MQDYIQIEDTQTVEESFINYTVYRIKGVRKGEEFTIHRRYNDFVLLKEAFNKNWPGCFIPPIPSKKHIVNNIQYFFKGNLDSNVIAYRQKYLTYFLKKLIEINYLWMSKEMECFIYSNPEKLHELTKGSLLELIQKYQNTFQFQSNLETNIEIDKFSNYINNTLPMISNFQKMAKNVMKARDQYNYEEINFIENFLPQFEKLQIMQNEQGKFVITILIVFSGEEQKQQYYELKHHCHKNEFIKVYDFTKSAERELQACKDALTQRQNIVQKLKEDEEKLIKLNISLQEVHTKTFIFQNKEEKSNQLKAQIGSQENIVDQMKQIVELLNQLLIQQEIPKFYELNKDKYQQMIRFLAEFKVKQSQAQVDYWKSILVKL